MKYIHKVVPVLASFNSKGNPVPVCFRYCGRILHIERVLQQKRSPSLDNDGVFFLVLSCGRMAVLFWRRDNVWILEKF